MMKDLLCKECGEPKGLCECAAIVVAIAIPPKTGLPLSEFTYNGKLPDKKFIRENGPSEAYSNAEDYDATTTTTSPDTQVNKP